MIPLTRPYFDEEEIVEIRKVLESGWVSQGPKVKEFEDKFAKYIGVKNAVAVSNCTAALHLSLLALGIKSGDEVLVADYTFPATGHAVLYCNAKPVFIDVDPKTYNIDPKLIERKITNNTKAIIPVHTFGQPADMDPIVEIAERHDLRIIEDAACAVGSKYRGKYAGTIGDLGCFSFHARKGLTTGEGGMITTDDDTLASEIRTLANFGMTSAWERERSKKFSVPKFLKIGYNYKLSDIAAAIGIAQLRRLNKTIKRKRKLAKYWNKKLQEIEFLKPPYVNRYCFHTYQSYVCVLDEKFNRNRVIEGLHKKGIQTNIGTYASHIQPVYKSRQKCPQSLKLFKSSLSLPIYYTLTEKEIDIVAEAIKKMLKPR